MGSDNSSAALRFRRDYGMTLNQYECLREYMKNGEIKRRNVRFPQWLHPLKDSGIVEFVPSTNHDPLNDSWRLTERGRFLMALLGDGQGAPGT